MPEERSHCKLGEGVVGNAITFPFRHFFILAKIGTGPILTILALYLIIWELVFSDAASLPAEDFLKLQETLLVLDFVLWAATFMAGIVVAVRVHRFIVLGEQPGWTLFRFRKWEAAYLLTIVSIALIYLAVLAIVGEVLVLTGVIPETSAHLPNTFLYEYPQDPAFHIVLLLIALLWAYPMQDQIAANIAIGSGVLLLFLFLRLALIFPHAAISGKLSFSKAWNATRGNFWSFLFRVVLFGLFVILANVIFVIVCFSIGLLLLKDLNYEIIPSTLFPIIWTIMLAFNGLIFIMSVALISYAYQDLVPRSEDDGKFEPA